MSASGTGETKVLFPGQPRSLPRTAVLGMVRRLPMRQRRSALFLRTHKRLPRVRRPRTFSEKLNWRILHDRRPELAWTCDKLEAKRRVAELCPAVRISEVYWSGIDLRELEGIELPERWILKPNAGCGLVLRGIGPVDANAVSELLRQTDGWLDQDLVRQTGEWAYGQSERCFFVEEMVGDGSTVPADYKSLVLGGEVQAWYVVQEREVKTRISYFSPDWQPLDVRVAGFADCEEVRPPASVDRMNAIAEAIAGDLDFLRVDLYELSGEIWFGETTPYPNGGLIQYVPRSFDAELGDRWVLPDLPA